MSDTWVPAPRKAPYRCRRTGLDSPAEGPYFEESLLYCEAPGDDRELTVYHSPQWLKAICDAPGSPFVLLTREQSEENERIRAHRDDLLAEVEELSAEAEALRSAETVIDVQALANGLVVSLEDHFAKKSGPKPRGPKAAA